MASPTTRVTAWLSEPASGSSLLLPIYRLPAPRAGSEIRASKAKPSSPPASIILSLGSFNLSGSPLSNPTVQANQLLRQFPQHTGIQSFRKPTAESKYNAFTLRLNKQFSSGLSRLANFTGAKETDNSAAPITFVGQVSSTRINQFNPRADWAVGPQDISRVFSAGYVYELPFGRGKKFVSGGGPLNWVVGGWQADGIVRWTAGTPVVTDANVNDCSQRDSSNTCIAGTFGKITSVRNSSRQIPTGGEVYFLTRAAQG